MTTNAAELLSADAETLQLRGAVTFANAAALYLQSQRLLVPGITGLDCKGVRDSDSSAISLLLACRRLANGRGVDLRITGMGRQLLDLARLYGVEQLLVD